MSILEFKNPYPSLPPTKVSLLHTSKLDATALANIGFFSTVDRESTHILLTDSNVAASMLDELKDMFNNLRIKIHPVIVVPGESSKTIQAYTHVLDACADVGITKESTVIGIGGGVVKDLSGFLASTFLRGLNLVLMPTTVLAQVDAAIDWRHSLNLPHGKNLIGSILAPAEILINAGFLKSLNDRWIRDGLAESIKIALCQSPDFLTLLSQANPSDFTWLCRVIDISVSEKIVAMNRDSAPDQAMLVYGHAIGHAIEHLAEGELGHGEAISIGMCVTAELSLLAGLSDELTLKAHYNAFTAFGLPTIVPDKYDLHQIWSVIRADKRFRGDKMCAPAVKTIGTLVADGNGKCFLPFGAEIVIRALELNKSRGKTIGKFVQN
ncbi:Dehydroquinate synthase-like protein [Glarea lozoyensis ATCC 20868]|uniref:Dehydroquinate synthase-like protein n=1 Tax=Glarea lozoyensis (strain ATCC 20868 / MF5171) TaxID=1116229 RepID=S3CMM6_GLAL2|nr:Dehydroquinate synthase-like protein [Glarea lozoyensis ATCC 20868]EPE26464.1 Dehydroquinate synthase-like protein [Glarea lozoyensis ATCC 20868]